MAIEIRGIPKERALSGRISKQMTGVLSELRVKPVTAQVTFFDENGPKGGVAIRCALTVRLPYRPTVRVEHVGETPRLAFDGGFEALKRQLVRYQERQRERLRRPKKYYAAKRLLMAGSEPTEKE